MVGIRGVGQALVSPRQKIEVIAMEPMFRHHWMKPLWDHYHIIMPWAHYLIKGAICRIHLLNGVGFRFLEFVEIGFLLDGLQYISLRIQNPFIMLMGRKRAPVARWGVHFPHHDLTATKAWRYQVIELSGGIVPAENHNGCFIRCDEFCRMIPIRFAPSVSDIDRITGGREHKIAVPRDIECMGHSAENILASIFCFPRSLVTLHFKVSAEEHNDHFIVTCSMFPFLPFCHFTGPKAQIIPMSGLRGYAVIYSVCSGRFYL